MFDMLETFLAASRLYPWPICFWTQQSPVLGMDFAGTILTLFPLSLSHTLEGSIPALPLPGGTLNPPPVDAEVIHPDSFFVSDLTCLAFSKVSPICLNVMAVTVLCCLLYLVLNFSDAVLLPTPKTK